MIQKNVDKWRDSFACKVDTIANEIRSYYPDMDENTVQSLARLRIHLHRERINFSDQFEKALNQRRMYYSNTNA